jgi:hypothetical protein
MDKKKTKGRKLGKFILFLTMSLIVLLTPFLFISLFMWTMRYYNPITGVGEFKDTIFNIGGYQISLSNFTNYFLLFLQIIITTVFSYILWKTSVKSNDLAERIDKKDDDREQGIIRENALIVYYDITLGLNDLIKLYDSRIIHKKSPSPKRMFFSSDWIKNVAFLKDRLNHTDISELYSLYGNLLTVRDLLENSTSGEDYSELDDEVKRLFKDIMSENLIDNPPIISIRFAEVQSCVNNYYFYLLEKLKRLTYLDKQISIKCIEDDVFEMYVDSNRYYTGKMKDGVFEGKGTIWNWNMRGSKQERFEGEFFDGKLVEGIRHEKYILGNIFYSMHYGYDFREYGKVYNEDGEVLSSGNYNPDDKPNEGFFTLYDQNGGVKYVGEIKQGKYHGKGILFDRRIKKQGIWENGYLKEGTEYNVLVADSNDYDYYREQAELQSLIEKAQEQERIETEEFDEMFARGWSEYANILHKDGESKIIENTRRKEFEY